MDDLLAEVCQLHSLKHIKLHDLFVQGWLIDTACKALRSMPCLESVYLTQSAWCFHILDGSLGEVVASFPPSVVHVYLTGFDGDCLPSLLNAKESLKRLKTFKLAFIKSSSYSDDLVEILKWTQHLTFLDLSSHDLAKREWQAVLEVVQNLGELVTIF